MELANELAKDIWQKHVDVFDSFDLVCHNGNSLQDETMANGLFNALVTLDYMLISTPNGFKKKLIIQAVEYLKGSKYYSESNSKSDY